MQRRVNELGADTFIDVYDVTSGVVEEGIFKELPACRELVALLTPWSAQRNWLWLALGAARALGLEIAPILYRTTELMAIR